MAPREPRVVLPLGEPVPGDVLAVAKLLLISEDANGNPVRVARRWGIDWT